MSSCECERYYLRTLLHFITGAPSFKDILAVEGNVCATYLEACQRLIILADDSDWKRALGEALK